MGAGEDLVEGFQKIREKLCKLMDRREAYWRYRVKQFWLKDGDSNSKYFHRFASSRKKNNCFDKLKDEMGIVPKKGEGLEEMMVHYYKDLFRAEETEWPSSTFQAKRTVTNKENDFLTSPIKAEEIKAAVVAMHPDKSPGPDDDSYVFFKETGEECNRVKEGLELYARASGQ